MCSYIFHDLTTGRYFSFGEKDWPMAFNIDAVSCMNEFRAVTSWLNSSIINETGSLNNVLPSLNANHILFFLDFRTMASKAAGHKCVLCDAELETKTELQEHFR